MDREKVGPGKALLKNLAMGFFLSINPQQTIIYDLANSQGLPGFPPILSPKADYMKTGTHNRSLTGAKLLGNIKDGM